MKRFLFFIVIGLCSISANAAENIPVTARLFAGAQSIKSDDVDTVMTAQGFDKIDSLLRFGAEATYPVAGFLDAGFRYTRRWVQKADNDVSTDYLGELTQDGVGLILRVPFLRTKFLRVDAFGEYAGTNTTFSIKSASVNGKYEKKGPESWFGDSSSSYGASVGVGYNNFLFVVEVGYENNIVDGLTASGTTASNISSMDLSGSYVSIGLVFDGVAEKR